MQSAWFVQPLTGTAGFIGYHLTKRLVARGDEVVGLDIINDYYDVAVKHGRLEQLGLAAPEAGNIRPVASTTHPNLRFVRMDLQDAPGLRALFETERFDGVCNLAAQAGVRYSLTNPDVYISSNVQGFLNILEAVRRVPVRHLVYASSSSVYGIDPTMPFSETTAADHPASLYAVSKRSNELMAHSYSHLYGIPTTGLRFFTVYGPWGRPRMHGRATTAAKQRRDQPDMALFLFTKAMLEGRPIDVFNHGDMQREPTAYLDHVPEERGT